MTKKLITITDVLAENDMLGLLEEIKTQLPDTDSLVVITMNSRHLSVKWSGCDLLKVVSLFEMAKYAILRINTQKREEEHEE